MSREPVLGRAAGVRIVHVVYSFHTGGLEKGIATLVRNASPEFEHVITCLTNSGESERLLPRDTKVLELQKPLGNSPVILWKLSRTLAGLRPDIVHTRNWGGMDGIIAARLAGIRAVVHGEHGWDMGDPNGSKPRRVLVRRFLSRWVCEYTCVSRQIEEWLLNEIRLRKPVTRIYNGVDTEEFSPGQDGDGGRTMLGYDDHIPLVGTVGRLDPIKDLRTLIKAFELLRLAFPQAQLLVVGDGPERENLRGIATEGIVFLGSRSDVPEILRALDVFVLPSINEGMSNTILEAMATAIPVVATNVGGNPELIKDGQTGCLVEPGDSQSMASAILRYIEQPDLRMRHGKAGRDKVIREFSIRDMIRAYETVYRRVASVLGAITGALPGMP